MKAFVTVDLDKKQLERLKSKVDEVIYEPWHETYEIYLESKSLIPKLQGVDIFICEGDEVGTDVIEQSDLKIIASCRSVPDKVDVDAATKKNIPVLFTPGRNSDSVADLALTLILALSRKLTQVDRFIHSDKFEVIEFEDWIKVTNKFQGMLLKGKNVGIVGFGKIGQKVGDRLLPFGVNLLIYDPYIPNSVIKNYGKKVSLEELMERSDVVTIHAAQVPETRNMISKELIDSMKTNALFVNTARASIVKYSALYKALKEGRIGGAALDVFDIEPMDEDNEFLEFDNTICLPHFGSNTQGVIEIQSKMIIDDVIAVLEGNEPKNIKNPEVLGITPLEKPIKVLCQEIVDYCQILVEEGFISGSSGNVSVRVPDREQIIITPSTLSYAEMTAEDMVILNFDGKQVGGKRNPSVEKDLHLGIYRGREDVGAVIHSHGANSIAFSLVRDELPPIVEEFVPYVGGPVKVAKYGEAGSEELAENILDALGDRNAAMAVMHGNVCCGSHLKGAMTVLRMVEHVCRIYLQAAAIGEPKELDEDVVDFEMDMYEIFKEDKKV
ncbi:MAG: hypothetical protein GF364_14270 [Candidatus Lokiarchaeota archaeon]|nr:hypothetical protein [Candidatus Lokiarchaeota archaeon]